MEKLTNEYKIEFTKGDTYALAIKFKNITEDLRTAYFSVKENPDDTPLIQKSLGAGIDKIDDRAYKKEKTYKFQLQPADTVNLEAKVQYLYDIQVCVGNIVKTVLHGVFVLKNTITGTGVTTQEIEVAVDDELEIEVLTTPATNGVEYELDPVACAKIGNMATLETDNKETIVKAINEVNKHADTNAEDINKIKNGTIELPSAKNVSETINGKNISEIFENDGVTVKNSKNASNITGQINGKNISEIFENDGLTVKNSTKVNNLEILIDENGVLKVGDIIVPQRKVIWEDNVEITSTYDIAVEGKVEKGDILEIATAEATGGSVNYHKFKLNASTEIGSCELSGTCIIIKNFKVVIWSQAGAITKLEISKMYELQLETSTNTATNSSKPLYLLGIYKINE